MDMSTNPTPEENLATLGLALPAAPSPGGNYVAAKLAGGVLYLSGVVSTGPEGIITGLAGKDRTEVNFFGSQTDAAAVGDDNDLVVERVVDVGQSLIGARGGLIDFGRALHVQSFVRTFLVEDLDKAIEPSLLLQEVASGRLGGFFLQR